MDRLRLAAASVAIAIPAVVFALNAFISYRERGIVEPLDVPAAIAFAALAALVWRGWTPALVGAAALVVVYLVSAAVGGVLAFVLYWAAALVLAPQALLIVLGARARSAV